MGSIRFFTEKVRFKLLHPRKTSNWILNVASREGWEVKSLNYIICSDAHLQGINAQYLKHDYFTDIITFDHADEKGKIEGDIFISLDRVRDNASKYRENFDTELHRVIIHGLLHLVGYSDKSPRQKSQMRKKEDTYLSLR